MFPLWWGVEWLFDSDEEEEDNIIDDDFIVFAAAAEEESSRNPPASFHVRDRLEWEEHVAQLMLEGESSFSRMYRMSYESFQELARLLHPFISVNATMSKIRTGKGPITTEIALHCVLRWLAGGSYLDIRLCAGISVVSFYRCIHKCMEAILLCAELDIHFPTTSEEIEEAAEAFASLSSQRVFQGCVAPMDGFLLLIITPSASDTANSDAYYSGHYAAHGINIQAACDHRCRFVFVAVAAPGRQPDVNALRKTGFKEIIESLPMGRYVLGRSHRLA